MSQIFAAYFALTPIRFTSPGRTVQAACAFSFSFALALAHAAGVNCLISVILAAGKQEKNPHKPAG